MDLTSTIFEVIDMRSFSNLWFWIMLAVIWSTTSHWVLGVPFDMVVRARRFGGQAETDLQDLVRINVNRLMHIAQVSGLWMLGATCFILTVLVMLGFWYGVEFAQAVALIALPLSLVGSLTMMLARRIAAEAPTGEALRKRLIRHRFWTQLIGMSSIFVTAMYGMYHNLAVAPGF